MIDIRITGILKDFTAGRDTIPARVGETILLALKAAGIPTELVALALVNGVQQPKDTVLKQDDVVTLYTVMGGG